MQSRYTYDPTAFAQTQTLSSMTAHAATQPAAAAENHQQSFMMAQTGTESATAAQVAVASMNASKATTSGKTEGADLANTKKIGA